jgi:hypothetical protein
MLRSVPLVKELIKYTVVVVRLRCYHVSVQIGLGESKIMIVHVRRFLVQKRRTLQVRPPSKKGNHVGPDRKSHKFTTEKTLDMATTDKQT